MVTINYRLGMLGFLRLKDAFTQAQEQMRTEAVEEYLQKLVEEGRLSQEEADDYFNWWQAKPDVPAIFGFRGHGGFRGVGGMRAWGGLCIPTQ